MKKGILSAMTGLIMAGQAFAACPYAFDATAADYASGSLTPFPVINNSLQQAGATVSAGSGQHYVAFSHQLIANRTTKGDINVPASGIFVYENHFVNFPDTVPQDGNLLIGNRALLSNASETIAVSVYLGSDSTDSSNSNAIFSAYNVTTGQHVEQTYPVSLPVSSNFRMGIYINQISKQIGLIVNGVNKGYFSSVFQNPIQAIGFIPLADLIVTNANDPVIGKQITTRLITSKADISSAYPSGAQDICGNTL